MRTDKQVYLIFRAGPELAFELAGLPSPGPCRMESATFKEIERAADGLIVPEDEDQPITLFEVQFYDDRTIYNRCVTAMALAQQPHVPRPVQGLIFFASRALDPMTQPWHSVVRPVYLDEALHELANNQPLHPLVAVFAPVLIESTNELEKTAKLYYRALDQAAVAQDLKDTLLRVFCDWLFERLKHKTHQELTMILDLPDVRETVIGRQLINEGLEQGLEQGIEQGLEQGIESGRREALVASVKRVGIKRFGPATINFERQIVGLPLDTLGELLDAMLDLASWEAVADWLNAK